MKCPGQDSRYWRGDAIFEVNCPKCKASIEFFKDDTSRKCPSCGHRVPNPEMDFGCAEYCPYAQQCLGNLPGVLGDINGKQVYRGIMEKLRDRLSTTPAHLSKAMKMMDIANDVAKRSAESLGPVLAAVSLLVFKEMEKDDYDPDAIMDEYQSDIPGFSDMRGEVSSILNGFESGVTEGAAGVIKDIFLLINLDNRVSKGEISRDEAKLVLLQGSNTDAARGVAEKILG